MEDKVRWTHKEIRTDHTAECRLDEIALFIYKAGADLRQSARDAE